MTIASGVSSMIRSTPVAASSARMLRPSRPMIRPFMSSEGSSTTETVASTTCRRPAAGSPSPMMRRAFWVACSMASSSIRRISPAASSRASFSIDLTRSRLASTAVRPEICSSRLRCSSMSFWTSASFPRAASAGRRPPFPCGRTPLPALLLGELAVEVLLLLLDPLLEAGDLLAPGLDGLVELGPGREDLLLGLDVRLAEPAPRPGASSPRREPSRPRCGFLPAPAATFRAQERSRRRRSRPRRPRRPPRSPSRSMCSFRPPKARGRRKTRRRLHDGRGSDSSDEGSALDATGPSSRPLVFLRVPDFGRGADASPSGAQGVVQFSNQALRTGSARPSGRPVDVFPTGKDRPKCSGRREWQFSSYPPSPSAPPLPSFGNRRSGPGRECSRCRLRRGRCTSVRRSRPESRCPAFPSRH